MTSLSVPVSVYDDLIAHLASSRMEQVAFLFSDPPGTAPQLRVREIYRVPRQGFLIQSDRHVSLTDDVRAKVIKRAHDLDGCLVEVHSHGGGAPVCFSGSDLRGFEQWVPHVRWRLRRRTYVALVFAGEAFDALVWEGPDNHPSRLTALEIDGRSPRSPSGITFKRLSAGE